MGALELVHLKWIRDLQRVEVSPENEQERTQPEHCRNGRMFERKLSTTCGSFPRNGNQFKASHHVRSSLEEFKKN